MTMKDFLLKNDELVVLRSAHKAERNLRAAYKINAVILLGIGWKLKHVKEVLLLDDETLRSYVEKYRKGGIQKLIFTNHKGAQSQLDEKQIEQLCEELEKSIYLTTRSIIEYVENRFHTLYSLGGMRDLLHRIGYEYKKPKLVPGNPDIDAQEVFVSQYEDFMLKKPSDTEVLFIDAVHPEHNAMAAYGWIKRGQKRKVKTNSGRQRLNLHGALNAETLEITIIESETVNTDSTIQLIEVVDQKYSLAKEIILLVDNAKYHYSKEVQKNLKDHPRIRMVFLPSYAPNLNLIERLWKFFKKKVLYNQYHENIKTFRATCINFFKNIDQYADEITSLMSGGFEIDYT
ncbi:MAG: IS630 family transposase [Gammaproteobacteria bacterium]|nr:IS630 family transposase [Gammaproteobacteria bacterium]